MQQVPVDRKMHAGLHLPPPAPPDVPGVRNLPTIPPRNTLQTRGDNCNYIHGMDINDTFGLETASPNVTPYTLPDILNLGTTPPGRTLMKTTTQGEHGSLCHPGQSSIPGTKADGGQSPSTGSAGAPIRSAPTLPNSSTPSRLASPT